MDVQVLTIVFSIVLGAFSLVCASVSLVVNLRNKLLINKLLTQIEEVENDVRANLESNEADADRTGDHARRIAWLETRVRKPEKARNEDFVGEIFAKRSSAPNMTERRHRVLTLAKRGQDATTIASSLGMLIGEVELIMNLGRGSNNCA